MSNSTVISVLDPLRFPLCGTQLIEASAGTGKTYTIAMLYLRLVLGHGGAEAAFARALNPPEILVMTFTEAATKELRDRIRARLSEAAACFRDETGRKYDKMLIELRGEYPAHEWPGCARRLQLAAEWMDEAAVSTIHAWCHRMLREHAFDSGSLFMQQLESDQSELQAEAVRDYWRSFIAPMTAEQAEEVGKFWACPDDLAKSLATLLKHVELLAPASDPAQHVAAVLAKRHSQLMPLKAPWQAWLPELKTLFDKARASKAFDGRKLRSDWVEGWLQALQAWADTPKQITPELSDSAWHRLSQAGLDEAWKNGPFPGHPAITALEGLRPQLQALPDCREGVLQHAARWVAERFAEAQRQRAQMGFDDLLSRLAKALDGPHGPRLAERIRRQFPVALIDEFQDTDPLQYHIFERVYVGAADNALVLIGDPKQAIYRFRGADIHTYLKARCACTHHYTLQHNYRSTAEMVAASNHCFDYTEQMQGPGRAFRLSGLPFIPATAAGQPGQCLIEGQAPVALTLWNLPEPEQEEDQKAKLPPLDQDRSLIAEACAAEITRLLNLARQGQALLIDAEGEQRPLRAADIAVLVNNRKEAERVRGELDARGVRSVYLSDRDSVFQSPQAEMLQHWLVACAEPDQPRRLRAALATETLGLDWADIEKLNRDEQAWEAMVLRFRGYRDIWRQRGVLPMLRALLNDFAVPARLLAPERAEAGGERALTDLLHLAELLQHAGRQLDGEHALIRHLAEQRAASRSDDSAQIRLESDAERVQVITVHKSKGLQYPLVFLPFAAEARKLKQDKIEALYLRDDQDQPVLHVYPDSTALAQANEERLAEDLRKLYVALTRAKYATWVGVAPRGELANSALGHLISAGQLWNPNTQLADLPVRLQAFAKGCKHLQLLAAPLGRFEVLAGADEAAAVGQARQMSRSLKDYWWIASYSALRIAGDVRSAGQVPDTAQQDNFHEAQQEQLEQELDPAARAASGRKPQAGTAHSFERGGWVGTFLHDLLEWAAKQGFAALRADPAPLRDMVARRCKLRGLERWIDMLYDWLLAVLQNPIELPQGGCFTLDRLGSYIAEMEFLLACKPCDVYTLDELVCQHTLGGELRPALQFNRLNGMLKGFIDLVFEHEGRYYVLDYKSNYLGPDDAAYTPQAMRKVILDKRYELQYVLYLLALHRLLRARLPDYDYERHIGGAVYLFLRGHAAPGAGVHFERPPRQLIETLDELLGGTRQAVRDEETCA